MEDFIIKGSKEEFFIPNIEFIAATGQLTISGESYLEDTKTFYKPVIDWLDDYLKSANQPVTLNIKLTYYNTASSKSLLQIFYKLKEYEDRGKSVTANWFYTPDDLDIEEEVEDFVIDTGLKINLIKTNK